MINNIKNSKISVEISTSHSPAWFKLSLVNVFLDLFDFLDTVEVCEANDLDQEVSCNDKKYPEIRSYDMRRTCDDADDLENRDLDNLNFAFLYTCIKDDA